jgi:hypothetical protein
MGNLKFCVSDTAQIDSRVWQTAYITGIEGVPWHCRHQLTSDQFIIGRELDESGKVNIVWPTRTGGNLCLVTGSLRESSEAYGLSVEIARGTVGRLKNQTAEWQRIGMRLPDQFFPLAESATRSFLQCLTHKSDLTQQEKLAQSAIDDSIQASTVLCQAFSHQALTSRRQSEGPLTTLMGVGLPNQKALVDLLGNLDQALNLISVRPDMGSVERDSGRVDYDLFDAQVDWAVQKNLKLGVGPLVDFRTDRLPKWMVLLGEDYKSILHAACQHAENTVKRYRNRAQFWNCAAGLNSPNSMHWSDEEVLRMAVAVISTVRQADNRTPVLLTIEQPWSEYLRDNPNGISPLHFADALIRADLGLSGLALELAMDVWPGGSLPRDLIEVSRLMDRWAMLGLPLLVHLSSPTQAAAGTDLRVADWQIPLNGSHSKTAGSDAFVPPEALIQLLVSKPAVHAVIWDQLTDQYPVATSCSGLFDRLGQPKRLLQNIASLRSNFLT